MPKIKKELLMAISIPIIFTIGVVAFFRLLSPENVTLGNFISYASSLSTILMVLVVVYTTYLQLSAMKQQLEEMESARTLQTQPLPFITPLDKSYLEELRVMHDVPESQVDLIRRMFFYFEVENVGNGTAVAIDVIPKLIFTDEKGEIITEEPVWHRIDSLKQNEKSEEDFMFTEDVTCAHIRNFLSENRQLSTIELTVLYQNILGACFREKLSFQVWFYDDDEEKLKSCLKLYETAKIDYAQQLREANVLAKSDDMAVGKIIDKLSKELSKSEGCEDIEFFAYPVAGSFHVTPISEEEYRKELKDSTYSHLLGRLKVKTDTQQSALQRQN